MHYDTKPKPTPIQRNREQPLSMRGEALARSTNAYKLLIRCVLVLRLRFDYNIKKIVLWFTVTKKGEKISKSTVITKGTMN